MKELSVVLQGFREATRCDAAVWLQPRVDGALVAEALSSAGLRPPPVPLLPEVGGSAHEIHMADDKLLVANVPGARRAWLSIGPCPPEASEPLEAYLRF